MSNRINVYSDSDAGRLVEPERGPGRPEIGPPVHLRLPEDLIGRLDQEADSHGETRAATVRRLLAEQLQATSLP